MDHTNHVPKKEWMAYCVGALGQGMVYAIMSSYISDFYISVLKLTPLFVLLLMLLARVWDAINDPIMGYIMDHANPKNGKMKPYLIYYTHGRKPSTACVFADHGPCGDHLLHRVQCGGRQGGHQQGHGLGCLVRATGL